MFRLRRKQEAQTLDLNIPSRVVIRVLLLVVVLIMGLAAVRQASHALTLIFTAIFLALALNAPVHWLAGRLPGKRRGSRTLATGISFLVVLLVLAGFLVSIVPPLVRQTSSFINAAPELLQQTRTTDNGLGRFVARYNLQDDIDKFSKQLSERLGDIGSAAVSSFSKITSSVFAIVTVLALTFMMLIEGPRWGRFLRDLVPDEHHARLDRLSHDMYGVVKGYVNGQVALAVIASLMLLPALLILGISYPAALVVVVFICGLIPLVGHTIGAIIVTGVALFTSPWAALIILCYYILYQQIENYVIQPRLQANTTNMSPLLVFTCLLIGISFGGLLGGLVAIPVGGCVRIFTLDYLRSRGILEASTYAEATHNKADPKLDA